MNPWDKIFEKKFKEALDLTNENLKSSPNEFDLRARAICNVLLSDYNSALVDFKQMLDKEKASNRLSDDTFLFIGLCYYAISDFANAEYYFSFPLTHSKEIKYITDISRPSSILYFISIKLANDKLRKIAERDFIKRRLLVHNYLLGKADDKDLDIELKGETGILLKRKACCFEFYKAVKKYVMSDLINYKKHLEEVVRLEGGFLEYEYYFSKVELEKINCA